MVLRTADVVMSLSFVRQSFMYRVDRVENALVAHTILEVRTGQRFGCDGLHEVVNCVREGVLVAQDMAGGPPGLHVGVRRIRRKHASKAALVECVAWLNDTGATLFDVQWSTPHLASLGVEEIPRLEYLGRLTEAVDVEPRSG